MMLMLFESQIQDNLVPYYKNGTCNHKYSGNRKLNDFQYNTLLQYFQFNTSLRIGSNGVLQQLHLVETDMHFICLDS